MFSKRFCVIALSVLSSGCTVLGQLGFDDAGVPDSGPAGDAGCTPATCATGACGAVPDGCGGTLSCGGPTCMPPRNLCSADGWCWENPLPHGNGIRALWGSSPSDVWVVGTQGLIARWNGTRWVSSPSGTTRQLSAVWGTGPNDVFAAGEAGALLHFDGTQWTAVPGATTWLRGISGSGPNDVWVVGQSGTMLHYDGARWSTVPSVTSEVLNSVHSLGPSDAWAVGRGVALHWDGALWSPTTLPANGIYPWGLNAVWGAASNDVWAIGDGGGRALRWNGSAWTPVTLPTGQSLWDIDGTAADDVWIAGIGGTVLHWNGSVFTQRMATAQMPTRSWYVGIRAFSPSNVWAGELDGAPIVRWNGSSWVEASSSVTLTQLSHVWANGDNDTWAAGRDGTLLHWDGSRWAARAGPTSQHLRALWGGAGMWAVGDKGTVLRWNGAMWTTVVPPADSVLAGIWGSGPNDVWVVGDSPFTDVAPTTRTPYHWDGARWTASSSWMPNEQFGSAHISMWGAAPNDIWMADGRNAVVHFDGSAWSDTMIGQDGLSGVWGSAANDVWAVGDRGTIAHYDGSRWSTVLSGTTKRLRTVWGRTAADVWAAGDEGALMHWNGSQWSVVTSPSAQPIFALAVSPNAAWAVGSRGTILRK